MMIARLDKKHTTSCTRSSVVVEQLSSVRVSFGVCVSTLSLGVCRFRRTLQNDRPLRK
uniref:Uncharacterized protein n=1 Tax=Anopheles minimus TaxID=112268 RepID=A0A182WP34_9DIPT